MNTNSSYPLGLEISFIPDGAVYFGLGFALIGAVLGLFIYFGGLAILLGGAS